jgi:hypothetical protein
MPCIIKKQKEETKMWLHVVLFFVIGIAGFVLGLIAAVILFCFLLGKAGEVLIGRPMESERFLLGREYLVHALFSPDYPARNKGKWTTVLHCLVEIPGQGIKYFVVDQDEINGSIPETSCTIVAGEEKGKRIYSFKPLSPDVTIAHGYRHAHRN